MHMHVNIIHICIQLSNNYVCSVNVNYRKVSRKTDVKIDDYQ